MPEGPAFPGPAATGQPAAIRPTPGQPTPLIRAVRDALREAAGRVALRVPAVTPHRRRIAQALLQEGALAAGGVVVEGPAEDLLLLGAEAGRADRLRHLLDRLLGGAGTVIWSLERDAAALLRYAGGGPVPAAPNLAAPNLPAPDLAGLDGWLRAVPLSRVVRRQVGAWLETADGPLRPAFLRVEACRDALSALLGPVGQDQDLLDHAVQGIGPRLLKAMGDPAQFLDLLGDRLAGALHLPVPTAQIEGKAGDQPGGVPLVATVRLEDAAAPGLLARRRAALARLGWALEIDGLDAASLLLLAPNALPADVVRLHWSRSLLAPALSEAVRRIDPARLILAGVADQAALDWARGLGLRRAEGPLIDAAIAAARRMRGFGRAEQAVMGAMGQAGAAPGPAPMAPQSGRPLATPAALPPGTPAALPLGTPAALPLASPAA